MTAYAFFVYAGVYSRRAIARSPLSLCDRLSLYAIASLFMRRLSLTPPPSCSFTRCPWGVLVMAAAPVAFAHIITLEAPFAPAAPGTNHVPAKILSEEVKDGMRMLIGRSSGSSRGDRISRLVEA